MDAIAFINHTQTAKVVYLFSVEFPTRLQLATYGILTDPHAAETILLLLLR